MGESSIAFAAGHISSPIMRSSRGKLFLYIAVLGAMCFVVLLLSNAHSSLKQLEGANDKCQQQRDSLSAQLQVLFEHKNRIAQSLQQEKGDHKHTKEEIQKQIQEEQSKLQQEKEKEQSLETQLSQLKANYEQLSIYRSQDEAKYKDLLDKLQTQKDEEINKLSTQVSDLLSEKSALEEEKNTLTLRLQQQSDEAKLAQMQLNQCNDQLVEYNKGKIAVTVKSHVDSNKEEIQTTVKPQLTSHSTKEKSNPIAKPAQKPAESNEAIETLGDKPTTQPPKEEQAKNDDADAAKQLPAPFGDPRDDAKKKKEEAELEKPVLAEMAVQESENHQQAMPPININNDAIRNGEEKNDMDHLEIGHFREKEPHPDNQNFGIAANQVQDMMDKSPGDANEPVGPQNVPPLQNKLEFNNRRGAIDVKAAKGFQDRHYGDEEEDDQDADNEEDPVGGFQGPNVKGFPPQEFDEAEPNENNMNNHKENVILPQR